MYDRIKQTPTVRQRYADQLTREGVLDAAQADAEAERTYQRLAEIQQSLKAHLAEGGAGGGAGEEPHRISGAPQAMAEPDTAGAGAPVTSPNEQLLQVPAGVTG